VSLCDRRHHRWLCLLGAILLCVLIAGGCRAPDGPVDTYETSQTYQDGPLSVTMKVSASELTVDQRLRVLIEVTAPASAEITLPDSDTDLGGMDLVAFDAAPEKVLGGGLTERAALFVLEPYLPGDYAIGPLRISCVTAEKEFAIETQKIDIQAISLLPPGDDSPELMDIAPLAEIRSDRWPANKIVALVAAAISLGCWGVLAFRRRRTPLEIPVVAMLPAHEIALAELDGLLAEKLIQAGLANEFYTRLSGIVRRYVESRFDFHPLVQTTQQFLGELARARDFDTGHKVILREFLGQCDMVKFAGRQPPTTAADQAAGTCRRFIDESQEVCI
jgi:hypothetical protein